VHKHTFPWLKGRLEINACYTNFFVTVCDAYICSYLSGILFFGNPSIDPMILRSRCIVEYKRQNSPSRWAYYPENTSWYATLNFQNPAWYRVRPSLEPVQTRFSWMGLAMERATTGRSLNSQSCACTLAKSCPISARSLNRRFLFAPWTAGPNFNEEPAPVAAFPVIRPT
jgi:hypothetical protein